MPATPGAWATRLTLVLNATVDPAARFPVDVATLAKGYTTQVAYREGADTILKGVADWPAEKGVSITIDPVLSRQVFEANLGKLGLIKPEQVAAVLGAYHSRGLFVKHLREIRQPAAEETAKTGIAVDGGNLHA